MKETKLSNGSVRCDPDDPQHPTFIDRLARAISDSDSPQPGRLCMIPRDYKMAGDVLSFLSGEGIAPPIE
jgi:hypothetical protein